MQVCAEILRAAFWFNPLTWIATRCLRRDSEMACDDAVLSLGVDGPNYATQLLDLATVLRPQRTVWSPGVAMARPSALERRITAMMNVSLNRRRLLRGPRVAICILALCVTVPIALLAQQASATF